MSDWAVVIGVNNYPHGNMSLKGAVRDALGMRTWLVDPAGGNVPEQNVLTALSPLPGEDVAGVQAPEATRQNFIDVIVELIERSGGQGERLFLYYAGHGLTARVNYSDENILLTSDFTPTHSDNSCTLRSLFEFLQTTHFANQFIFIDACRDVPFEREFVPGRWTLPGSRDPGQAPVQQFILYATSPGVRAAEYNAIAGKERGAFTEVLLDALGGKAAAKAWSSVDGNYNVRWDGLVNYVMSELRQRKLNVGTPSHRDLIQIPQQDGARSHDPNPVIATFDERAFEPENLEVFLEPDSVASVAEVAVIDLDTYEPLFKEKQIAGLPLTFQLPPKPYGLLAMAPNYERFTQRPPVELYQPQRVTLRLREASATEAAAAMGTRAIGDEQPSALTVQAPDQLSPVEITDPTGRVLAVSRGTVQVDDLAPGLYRARLRSPEGRLTEQVVELGPGETEHVLAQAPSPDASPAVQKLFARANIQVRQDRAVDVPDVGPVVDPHLSTLLALAASRAIRTGAERVDGGLGVTELTDRLPLDSDSALSVLIGFEGDVEQDAANKLSALRVRFWRFWQNVPDNGKSPEAFADAPGTGSITYSGSPGQHWLAIEGINSKPLVFALALLPDHITTVVVQIRADGLPQLYQYMPAMDADESSHPDMVRRHELIQRISLSTRLDAGYDIAQDLLDAEHIDPLAGCLGAYLLLRMGRAEELGVAVDKLRDMFSEISDVHVIAAEFEAARGRQDRAELAIERAFQVGVPVTGEGLARLLDAVGVYRINHPSARLVSLMQERHVDDSLWAAWTPDSLISGGELVP